MAATERPPLRGASVETRVLAVAGRRGPRAQRPPGGRGAARDPRGGPGQEAVRVAVTMRTPGNDFELAAGFLHSEGLLRSPLELAEIKYCTDVELGEQAYNVVTVHLRRPFEAELVQRNFGVTSACGVCGKASIDSDRGGLRAAAGRAGRGGGTSSRACPSGCAPRSARSSARAACTRPGCSRPRASSTLVREDVGRHNALDKVIGNRLLAGATPLGGSVALVSGRASFELVQKAAVAGIPVLCAVGAPSSLAVDAARRLGLTLVGFLRDERFNIYAGAARIALASP